MNSEIDLLKDSEKTFDALLDEINKQKRQISQLQSENRVLKTSEIRTSKTAESFKAENFQLHSEITSLTQKVRELEIQLTLPSDERTIVISREVEPFPKKKPYQLFNWSYVVVPVVALAAVFIGKWWAQEQNMANNANMISTSLAAVTNPDNANAAAQPQTNSAASTAVDENYIVIDNPLEKEGMVRVMDGYNQKARILAWINPNDKFRIRAQSPQKMRRTYVKDGKNVNIEDYFYKISDKEQWVFGYFTNKRITQ
jgi:hypothetical protein